jgi:hypothetical protein
VKSRVHEYEALGFEPFTGLLVDAFHGVDLCRYARVVIDGRQYVITRIIAPDPDERGVVEIHAAPAAEGGSS